MSRTSPARRRRGAAAAVPGPNRRMWFGPGTVLALVALGIMLVAANVNRQPDLAGNTGRVVYQADSQGRLQRVEPAGIQTRFAPTRPLWKPEVGFLLESDLALGLNAGQRRGIVALDTDWRLEKAGLEASMREASATARSTMERPANKRGASLQLIQTGLRDYSELSRQFDARRAEYWLRGTALLNTAQRDRVERLALNPRVTPRGRTR